MRWYMIVAVALVLGAGEPTRPAEPKPTGKTYTVVIKGFAFQPERLEVAAGDTVIWKNEDIVPHTATTTKKGFDSKGLDPGQRWSYVTRRAGSFAYICSFHPTMKGELVVK